MSAIAAVLFDRGGVACRFLPVRRLAALAAASCLPADEVQARLWRSGFDAACDRGAYDAAAMRAEIGVRLGVAIAPARLAAIWASAFEPDPALLALARGVRSVGPRVALLTDNGPLLREALPERLPALVETFAPLLFSCDLGACKPEPALFRRAAAAIGEPPDWLLLIDDTAANVRGARAVGLAAIHYRGADALAPALPAYGLSIGA